MKIRNYTEEQIEYIKDNYFTKTAKEIGEHIGKTPAQVTYVALERLKLSKRKESKWSEEEVSFLKNNYKLKTHAEMGKYLNRAESAVRAKCFDLNLYKKETPWTEADYQYVRDHYMNMQTSEIADHLHRSSAAVKVKAKQMGLKKYPYCCDYHYFDKINTEEKAYWLGFLSADGWISRKEGSEVGVTGCELQYRDIDHLKKMNKSMSGNYKIVDRWRSCGLSKTDEKKHMCSIRIYSSIMCESLERLGFTNRKSFDCKMPTLNPVLIRHFIRGYFDGNGCVCFNKEKYSFNVDFTLSSLEMRNAILDLFASLNISYINNDKLSSTGTMIYRPSIRYNKDKILFLKYMYDNCSIYLDRKYQKYLNVLDNYNQHESLAC